jgi:adenine phosphoribosyltransferase
MKASDNPVESVRRLIRAVPDFPKPGIMYRDITPMLADPGALALSVELMANPFRGGKFDLVPVRKPGKLPSKAVSVSYSLEYGKDSLEMHDDALHPGAKVLVVDDLLATGGTLKACCELVERVGGTVGGATALIELEALGGRARIAPRDVHTVIRF